MQVIIKVIKFKQAQKYTLALDIAFVVILCSQLTKALLCFIYSIFLLLWNCL